MIVGIRGNLGNGKTATLAWLAHHYRKKGFKIHSNFWITDIAFNYITCIEDIDKIRNGYVFFDELWTWIDSRGSGFSDINLSVTGILHKSRKRGYNIFYESKLIHMTDRRIRELTDYVLEPNIYLNVNGTLERIEQDMLEPIDLKPYLDRLWVIVSKYEFNGEELSLIDEDIMFKLSDVINTYDTREEIGSLREGERSPGFEKGCKIENAFVKYLEKTYPGSEIGIGKSSRGWDVTIDKPNGNACYDVISPQYVKDRDIWRISVRGKKIQELLDSAKAAGRQAFWAFHLNDKWYSIPMKSYCDKKATINCKYGEEIK